MMTFICWFPVFLQRTEGEEAIIANFHTDLPCMIEQLLHFWGIICTKMDLCSFAQSVEHFRLILKIDLHPLRMFYLGEDKDIRQGDTIDKIPIQYWGY